MDNINIITIIAVVLFARLGLKLLVGYKEMKKEKEETYDNTL